MVTTDSCIVASALRPGDLPHTRSFRFLMLSGVKPNSARTSLNSCDLKSRSRTGNHGLRLARVTALCPLRIDRGGLQNSESMVAGSGSVESPLRLCLHHQVPGAIFRSRV